MPPNPPLPFPPRSFVRIIRDSTVRNQDELVKALHNQGFEATQVERDPRFAPNSACPSLPITTSWHRPKSSCPPTILPRWSISSRRLRTAGDSLAVVKTTAGTANSVAVAIDASDWPEVVGTISGDDTIFIATEDSRAQRKLRDRLREIFRI